MGGPPRSQILDTPLFTNQKSSHIPKFTFKIVSLYDRQCYLERHMLGPARQ
jgi:hypothetical protein